MNHRNGPIRAAGRRLLTLSLVSIALCVRASPFDATSDFSITNGNPNGAWSYGWSPTDFSAFTLFTNSGLGGGVNPQWNGWYVDDTPVVWLNGSGAPINGVQPGQLALHPGPGNEPCVLRWTAPMTGHCTITGRFFAGDSGTMQVAVRRGSQVLWQQADSGTFDLSASLAAGEAIDFAVYGGYAFGSTPLTAVISQSPARAQFVYWQADAGTPDFHATGLVVGASYTFQRSAGLAPADWTNLAVFSASGAETNLSDDAGPDPGSAFYRLRTD